MIKQTMVALCVATFAFTSPAVGQSAQDRLENRYNRALAAGYKALMLCSAIANAESNGATRTPKSVEAWELNGIQAPLDEIIDDLEYEIVRRPSGQIAHVAVKWDQTAPRRIAVYFQNRGCSLLRIGAPEGWSEPERDFVASEVDVIGRDEGGLSQDRLFKKSDTGAKIAKVAPILDQSFRSKFGEGTRTTAALVMHNGALVSEQYHEGFTPLTPQRTWSVAKSIAATLVGAAVQSGEFNVDEPVGLNYWRQGGSSDPRNGITIDHMLRMASGRYSDMPGNRSLALYWGGSTVNETAAHWPVINKPGTVFRYANNDTLMAVKAIDTYLSYYQPAEFFEKVGMNNTVAETDMRDDYILSSQVWSTARDLARLGQLYLNDGVWHGERLLPENWRKYVSVPSGPQPKGRPFGYGAGFWLMNKSDGIPADAFLASGRRGQFIVIIPSKNVVIVRRGEDPRGARFNIALFTRDVLTALEE